MSERIEPSEMEKWAAEVRARVDAARDVMWICATSGACLCTGEEYDCQCRALHDGARGRCLDCGARMVLIDTGTGEVLSPPTSREGGGT